MTTLLLLAALGGGEYSMFEARVAAVEQNVKDLNTSMAKVNDRLNRLELGMFSAADKKPSAQKASDCPCVQTGSCVCEAGKCNCKPAALIPTQCEGGVCTKPPAATKSVMQCENGVCSRVQVPVAGITKPPFVGLPSPPFVSDPPMIITTTPRVVTTRTTTPTVSSAFVQYNPPVVARERRGLFRNKIVTRCEGGSCYIVP